MRHLAAILILMTVLLASISCGGADEKTVPGNGESQPIAEPQPVDTRAEPSTTRAEPASTGAEPATTKLEPATTRAGSATTGAEPGTTREEQPYTQPEPVTTGVKPTNIWPEPALETRRGKISRDEKPGTGKMGKWGNPGRSVEDNDEHIQTELKAGEVDDNRRWQEYLDFVEEYGGPPVHATNLSNRQIITVLDRQGNPVPNAQVNITRGSDGTGAMLTKRTYADGRTMFFPLEGLDPGMVMRNDGQTTREFSITARRDGFTRTIIIVPKTAMEHEVNLEGTMTYGLDFPLDVVFLIDSTGSMADEIFRIKATLESIAMQVSNLPSNPSLRFGMVSYRDRGDEYVTQIYPFDGNVQRFSETIRNVQAGGGDDYPESLNQALHEAVNDMGWRDNAIRLVFLIADAPPHLDYPQDENYATEMVRAQEKGIKVFSVASSGLDKQGEYIFRQIAQQTMGKFLFILYATGPGGSLETSHDVEQYSIDRLDSLIVQLIEEELEKLRTGAEQSGMMMK